MGNRLNKKIIALSFVSILGIAGCMLYLSSKISLKTNVISYSWAIDIKNPKEVYDNSDFIFIGKVNKKVETIMKNSYPETRFSVKVQQVIKGSIKDTIVVNQEGGINNYTLTIPEGDTLLVPGEKYLFIGKFDEKTDTYTLLPVYGDVLINNDSEIEKHVEKFKEFK